MTPNLNLKKNVIAAVVSFSVNLVLTFFIYKLVIESGGLAAVGLWSTLMSWIFLVRLGDVGMASAVVRFMAQCNSVNETNRIRLYLDTSLLMNTGLFAFLAGIGYLIFTINIEMILPINSTDSTDRTLAISVIPIMFTAFVFSNISGTILGGLIGLHQGYKASVLSTLGTIVQLFVAVPLVPKFGLAGLAWGQFAQQLVMSMVGWGMILMELKQASGTHGGILPRYFSLTKLREMLGFSMKMQLSNILSGLFEPISKIIIGRFGGLTLLGHYELAYKLVSLPRNAVVAGAQATTAAMTKLLQLDLGKARNLYNRSQRNLVFKGSIVLLCTLVMSPIASMYWLGHISSEFLIYTAILTVGFAFNVFSAAAYLLGTASGQLTGNIIANSVSLIIMVVITGLASFTSVSSLLIIGPVAGLCVGALVVTIFNKRILGEING